MKTITILFSIFCLLHTQLPQAYAQSVSDEKAKTDSRVDEYGKQLDTEAGKDEGRSELKKDDNFKEYTDNQIESVLEIITLLMILITSPIFAASCPKNPDVWINMAAGVLVIIMEGILWGSYDRAGTAELKVLEGSKDDYSVQIEVMTAAMEQTLKAKNWMDIRFGIVVGATVLIGVAMAVVLIMSIIEVVRSWGAETPKAGSCYAYKDPKKAGPKQLYAQNPTVDWPMSVQDLADRMETAGNVGDMAFINQELEGLKSGAIKSPSIDDYKLVHEMEDFSEIIQGTDGIMESLVTQLRTLGNVVIPDANAMVESKDIAPKLAGIGIGVAAGVITAIVAAVKGLFIATKINGWIRAAFYGVEVVMMAVFSAESKKTADKYGDRADKYQELHEQLTRLLESQPGFDPKQRQGIRPPMVIRSDAQASAFGAADNVCTSGGSPGSYKLDTKCACRDKSTCKKSKMPSTNFAGFKTPGVVSGSAKLGENASNSLFNGDLKGAMANAEALGRNAAKIRGVNSKLRELANKKMVEYGQKPMDFNKMTKDMGGKLSSSVRDAYNGMSGSDQNALMAAVMQKTSSGEDKREKEEESAIAAANKGGSGKSSGGKKKSIFDFLGGDDDEDDKKKMAMAEGKDQKAKDLSEYEDYTKQISERTQTSIFKIIEIRYMKSAYPIFFSDDK